MGRRQTQVPGRECQEAFSRDPEHADRRLLLWQAVELLHAHFYQELLDEDTVGRSIEYAKELVEGFKSLAAQPESAIE
jgi:hypothetical protein